jgi:hypothetical protein
LFTKEDKNTNNGKKPDIKTGKADQTNPSDAIIQALHTRGAVAQINQVILLGLVFHFRVFKI